MTAFLRDDLTVKFGRGFGTASTIFLARLLFEEGKGDQIVRIFAYWAIVFFRQFL
jgi:hypothetical protein